MPGIFFFVPFLKPRNTVNNTCKNQADGVFLGVPHFATSVYKSTKHFDLSFGYDTPKIWNDLPDDERWPLLSTHSERSSNLTLCTSISTLNFCFSRFLAMALTPIMSRVNDYWFYFLCLVPLESLFRWRLNAMKKLLELESS